MIPAPTERLRFREMTPEDIDDMAALLGDPEVMRYYPRPKTREEARGWIEWNRGLYSTIGHGLWIVELRETGEFVGDVGLTPQEVDGTVHLEVGYRIRAAMHRKGFASEAAAACRDHARDALRAAELVAIINPDNVPSQRVAERIGLTYQRDGRYLNAPARIYAMTF
jgi:RimJ/RimL family protein N-acetyltransferase